MKVLIVDDDLAVADVIAFSMRRAGHEVVLAYDGQEALEAWKTADPDLILLDLNLPKLNGYRVCQALRAQSAVPIIILSVREAEDDLIAGLDLGADDYLTKPFSPRQLAARLDAVLRRARPHSSPPERLEVGELELDLVGHELRRNRRPVAHLTRLEMRLLEALMRRSGYTVPAEMLIDAVWGPSGGDRGMLKQLVYRLRRKIEPQPSAPDLLETVSSVGYALHPPGDGRAP